jgi:hypothetical protein
LFDYNIFIDSQISTAYRWDGVDMKKTVIAVAAAILLVLTAALLVTGCFGTFNYSPPNPSPTITPSPTPTPKPTPAQPTIIVPDDCPTISAAIANATDGYLIIVKNGTYNEHTLSIDKRLTIVSQYQNGAKIILHPENIHYNDYSSQWVTILPQTKEAIQISSNNATLSGFRIVTVLSSDTRIYREEIDGAQFLVTGNGVQVLNNTMANMNLKLACNGSKIIGNSLSNIVIINGFINGENNVLDSNQLTGYIWR